MRIKSEAKRQSIINAASVVFGSTGFEGSSMSDICNEAGCSRGTLYSYFASKEELFLEVMILGSQASIDAISAALDPAASNIEEALAQFGCRLLALIYSPEFLALRRLAMAEATRSEFGQLFYTRGRKKGDVMIADFLRQAAAAGKLRAGDPELQAAHLTGLLESELSEMLFSANPQPLEPARIEQVVANAIRVFMSAYGPSQTPASPPDTRAAIQK